MAQYKVLQDIEAEDKLLGPLSLRQFIYAVIVVVLLFIAWRLVMVQWLLIIPFVPPIIFFGLLAAPFGRDQSSEVWLLAKIKYFVFPKRRIWDQDGVVDLVSITAPKVVEKHYTKDFDKDEARSRLKALATTMDTRGWAIKNINTIGYQGLPGQGDSDRLLALEEQPPEALLAVKPQDDVLDANNNLGQRLGSQQAQSEQAHRQAILQKMHSIAEQQKAAEAHLPRIPAPSPKAPPAQAPTAAKAAAPTPKPTPAQPVTPPAAPAILKEVKAPAAPTELQVKNQTGDGESSDEVVVSLH